MKKQYRDIILIYFSEYVAWLLTVSFLLIVSFVAAVIFSGANEFVWLIPVLFLVIYLLTVPLLILYYKVSKDIKAGDIEKLTIKILEIQYDDRFTFKNRGGATAGRIKYKIIDENHNEYLLSTSNNKDMFIMFYPHPAFDIEIEVLKKSRLVLSMKIIENFKTTKEAREQQRNIKGFQKVFSHYF